MASSDSDSEHFFKALDLPTLRLIHQPVLGAQVPERTLLRLNKLVEAPESSHFDIATYLAEIASTRFRYSYDGHQDHLFAFAGDDYTLDRLENCSVFTQQNAIRLAQAAMDRSTGSYRRRMKRIKSLLSSKHFRGLFQQADLMLKSTTFCKERGLPEPRALVTKQPTTLSFTKGVEKSTEFYMKRLKEYLDQYYVKVESNDEATDIRDLLAAAGVRISALYGADLCRLLGYDCRQIKCHGKRIRTGILAKPRIESP